MFNLQNKWSYLPLYSILYYNRILIVLIRCFSGDLTFLSPVLFRIGFCKASFLPLLEFAYTSVLSFDFCSMADVAILARHLFMSEVLEICESVHKLMEEKQLTVYKKGEVQTVASTQDLPEQNGGTAPPVVSNEGTTTTLSAELGDCKIVLLVNGDLPEAGQNRELGQQPEPQVSSEA